jgi:hypothetical protein
MTEDEIKFNDTPGAFVEEMLAAGEDPGRILDEGRKRKRS